MWLVLGGPGWERGEPWVGRGAQEHLLGQGPPPLTAPPPTPGKPPRKGGGKSSFPEHGCRRGGVQAASTWQFLSAHPRQQPHPGRLPRGWGGPYWDQRHPLLSAGPSRPSPSCPSPTLPSSALQNWLVPVPQAQDSRDRAPGAGQGAGHAGLSHQQQGAHPAPRTRLSLGAKATPLCARSALAPGTQPRTKPMSLLWVPRREQINKHGVAEPT